MRKITILKNIIKNGLFYGGSLYLFQKLKNHHQGKWIFFIILMYSFHKYYQRSKAYLIYNKDSLMIENLLQKCPTIMKKQFYPSFLFQGSTLQTLVSTFLHVKNSKTLQFQNQDIIDPKNRKIGIYLSWVTSSLYPIKDENKIVFILPGLTGKPDNPYIQSLCIEVLKKGYKPVVYNYRVFSEKLELHRDEIVDLTDDLDFTLKQVQNQFPEAHIYGVGHSYGANQLVNYLGRSQENSIVKGAVSLANPYTMEICKDCIYDTIWDYLLAKVLSKGLERNKQAFEKIAKLRNMDIDYALNAKRVYEFDKGVVVQLYGYKNNEDYYYHFQSSRSLPDVKIPLLGISAEDDYIAHKKALPIKEFLNNKNTALFVTKSGGHVGWIQGDLWKMNQWFPKPTVEFLESVMQQNESKIKQQ